MKTTVRRNVTIEFETCDDSVCCGECASIPDVAKALKTLAAEAKEEGL